jgi:arsenical pump membrane protein
MFNAPAILALGVTVGLVISRPPVGRFGRLHPILGALPGVAILAAAGLLDVTDLRRAVLDLWRPLVTVSSVMATTAVAHQMGIFDRVARSIEIRTRGPVPRAFATVFVIGVLTATTFNNDAAILLLTPIVLSVVRRLYPRRQYLVEPFGFAVFMAAGVAPLSTSNPMNLVVAERAGIGFNAYALRMAPVSIVAALVSYVALRRVFRKELDDSKPAGGPEEGSLLPMEGSSIGVLVVVGAMFLSYPVLSYIEGPVWLAAAAGATLIATIGLVRGAVRPWSVVQGVAWDVLGFLFCIFLVALGLRNAGVVASLGRVYAAAHGTGQQIAVVGVVSALGSALLNNHPMAAVNALAVEHVPGDPRWRTLAALVGGDLGPRLLPMGSLAGLLWMEAARRVGVRIRTWDFVRAGAMTTVPALAASLALLWLEAILLGD